MFTKVSQTIDLSGATILGSLGINKITSADVHDSGTLLNIFIVD